MWSVRRRACRQGRVLLHEKNGVVEMRIKEPWLAWSITRIPLLEENQVAWVRDNKRKLLLKRSALFDRVE